MSFQYQEALELEVSLLEALLQRSRCSHARTKYYQRTSLAVRALHRSGILEWSARVRQWTSEKEMEKKNKTNSQNDSLWDRQSLKNHNKTKHNSTTAEFWQSIATTLHNQLPSVLSRLEYASEPLFLEISRGFFLPFCTVALGAIGRIRVFLMRMGHSVLDWVEQHKALSTQQVTQLRNQFTEQPTETNNTTSLSKQERYRKLRESIGWLDAKPKPKTRKTTAIQKPNHEDDDELSDKESNDKRDPTATESISNKSNLKTESNTLTTITTTSMDHNYDMGEPVVSSREEAEGIPAALPTSKRKTTIHAISNLESKTKKEKASEKDDKSNNPASKKEKKRKSKDGTSKSSSSSSGNAKKKKKKQKKQDFFDSLFG